MADNREVVTTVELDSGIGAPLAARAEGDVAAAKNGTIGFAYKDASGNVILPVLKDEGDASSTIDGLPTFAFKDSAGDFVWPQLNASGQILVSNAGAGTCLNGQAQAIAGSLSFTDVVTVTLSLTKTYNSLEYSGSCTHTTLWEIVAIDDVGGTPVETKVTTFMSGPGQFTVKENLDCGQFSTVGGTGTQTLVLRGKNLRLISDLHGYLGIKES